MFFQTTYYWTTKVCLFIVLLLCSTYGQRNSGIPEIDTLPEDDWYIEAGILSYPKAILYSAIAPGGGQIYSRHYIRSGFLIGLETFLLSDALIYRKEFFRSKNQEIQNHLDSSLPYLQEYSLHPGNQNALDSYKKFILKARTQLDLKKKHQDLMKSEITWSLGLHFYGIVDALEMVQKSRHPQPVTLSGTKAFWLALAMPGAGQIYNGKYGKFGLLWMAIGGSIASSYFRQEMVEYFQARVKMSKLEGVSSTKINNLQEEVTLFRKRRNQYFWGIGVLYLYSVGDAIVDAVLNDFDAPERFALTPGKYPFSLQLSYIF